LELLRKKLWEAEAELKQLRVVEERAQRADALDRGEYFMTVDKLWGKIPVEPLKAWEYNNLFCTAEQAKAIRGYQETLQTFEDNFFGKWQTTATHPQVVTQQQQLYGSKTYFLFLQATVHQELILSLPVK